jgi:hypothetical protein
LGAAWFMESQQRRGAHDKRAWRGRSASEFRRPAQQQLRNRAEAAALALAMASSVRADARLDRKRRNGTLLVVASAVDLRPQRFSWTEQSLSPTGRPPGRRLPWRHRSDPAAVRPDESFATKRIASSRATPGECIGDGRSPERSELPEEPGCPRAPGVLRRPPAAGGWGPVLQPCSQLGDSQPYSGELRAAKPSSEQGEDLVFRLPKPKVIIRFRDRAGCPQNDAIPGGQ